MSKLTAIDIKYIEVGLGWRLGEIGIERAEQLMELGATLDEVIEALTLL